MNLLSCKTIAIHHNPGEMSYSIHSPFHPPSAFPEYPFKTSLDEKNFVYQSVRETFRLLGLDHSQIGTNQWNPLGDIIKPGDKVLIKPNLVKHFNSFGYDPRSVVTHGSMVRAVLDYVYVALRGEGRIVLGDAPLQKTNINEALKVSGLDGVIDFYKIHSDVEFEFIDFRLEQAITEGSMVVSRQPLSGAQQGYRAVDVGKQSYLDKISTNYENYRVTDYDRNEMTQHHNEQTNEYLIPRPILESDVVLNLPKLKTHRKVGITVSLKNLVGINGYKDWLPHHTNGSVKEGGDEYLHPSIRKRIDTFLDEQVDVASYRWQKYSYRFGRLMLRFSDKLISYPDPYKEGSWWGNNTLWRTVLDLNRVLLYANKQGQMTDRPQRRYMSLVDGIMAGEEEGPLEPTPRMCGLVIAGFNPVLVDYVCARLMGFDPAKIPLIHVGLEDPRLGLNTDISQLRVISNESHWERVLNWTRNDSLAFKPSKGWIGNIELDN